MFHWPNPSKAITHTKEQGLAPWLKTNTRQVKIGFDQ